MSRLRVSNAFTYLEILTAIILLSIAASTAVAGWSLAISAVSTKRTTEMALYIGVHEMERLKAKRFLTMNDTIAIQNYDKYGDPVTAPDPNGYLSKAWSSVLINRDGKNNSEDLRELHVDVWNSLQSKKYESMQTLITFGGM